MRPRNLIPLLAIFICLSLATAFLILHKEARAEPDIFASPINAGCYIAGPNDCRFHVEPLMIYLSPSAKLVQFQIFAIPGTGNTQIIYDFRPDSATQPSNSPYMPSQVAQDFAATCGKSYQLRLQGQDTGGVYSILGTTNQFTCPSVVP